MQIRPLQPDDHDDWLGIRRRLWPDYSVEAHQAEMDRILADPNQAVFVAVRSQGGLGGFVETSLHPHALGCETQPIGYLEGWWVDPDLRRAGVGRQLLAAAETWARTKGCREMASDTQLDNQISLTAHEAAGYQNVGRLIHFRKRLD